MLTRSGLGAVVAGLVLVMLGAWWGYEEVVIIGAGVGALVLLALWVSQRPLRARVRRRINAIRVPRGDPILLGYRVRNDTRFSSSRATVIDRCDGQQSSVVIDPVPPGGIIDVPTTIPTRRRGVFPVGPFIVERIDPFHLAVGRWRDPDERYPPSVTVHPKVYELVGPQGAIRVVENESQLRRTATDPLAGFVSMREYVPGDDPRLIHWPTTARTGTLMVREHVEVRRPEFTIVLDTGADVGTPDDFEEAVDVAATLAVHALRSRLDVVVRTTSRTHGGRPTPLVDDGSVLDLLTPVQQTEGEDLLSIPALFAHGLDHTSVVVVTGPSGPSSRFAHLDTMIVVRVGAGARSGAGVAMAVADAQEFVRRWRSFS
jgi:uncharacterized protein (DUF58 family)